MKTEKMRSKEYNQLESTKILSTYLDTIEDFTTYVLNQLVMANLVDNSNDKFSIHNTVSKFTMEDIKSRIIVYLIHLNRWAFEYEVEFISILLNYLHSGPKSLDDIIEYMKNNKKAIYTYHIIKSDTEEITTLNRIPKDDIVFTRKWDKLKKKNFKKDKIFIDFIEHPFIDFFHYFELLGHTFGIYYKSTKLGDAVLIGVDTRNVRDNAIETIQADTYADWDMDKYLEYSREKWGIDDFEGVLRIFQITNVGSNTKEE